MDATLSHGCYLLPRLFAHLVACCCVQNKSECKAWQLFLRVVGSCCIRLHTSAYGRANKDATTPSTLRLLRPFARSFTCTNFQDFNFFLRID